MTAPVTRVAIGSLAGRPEKILLGEGLTFADLMGIRRYRSRMAARVEKGVD
jgi:hypothetical protein